MRTVMMLAFASWVLPSPIKAQELRLEVHAGQVTDERGEPQVGATVTPSFTRVGESAAVVLGGETIFPVTGGMIGTAGLRFRAWSAGLGAGGALSLEAAGSGSTAGFRSFGASFSPRGAYVGRTWSVAAGPHVGLAARPASAAEVAPDLWPFFAPGAVGSVDFHRVHGVVAEVRAGVGPLRWSGFWRTSRLAGRRWSDLQGEVALEAERLAVAFEAGLRTGDVLEEWAGVKTALQLRPGLALIARGGRYTADPLSGRMSGTRAEVGVRLSTGGSSTTGRPAAISASLPDGRTRLVLRAEPDVEVELVGDWTGWRPIPVEESGPGVYAVAVLLPPGTHRFAFVVDGVWRQADGYPTEPDGYGGRHSIVRVAGR